MPVSAELAEASRASSLKRRMSASGIKARPKKTLRGKSQ
jgi:hypothetical protein